MNKKELKDKNYKLYKWNGIKFTSFHTDKIIEKEELDRLNYTIITQEYELSSLRDPDD